MPITFVPVSVPDAATYTVKEDDSGLVHLMPNLTATCTITLPTLRAGLEYEFVYNGAAADAQNWVFDTTSDSIFFAGGVTFSDLDGDVQAPVYADGDSNSKITIVTPEVGTSLKFYVPGGAANWVVQGTVCSATTPTIADQ